jgi:intracellular sulfur oxidation DsrE/DsrF family protein
MRLALTALLISLSFAAHADEDLQEVSSSSGSENPAIAPVEAVQEGEVTAEVIPASTEDIPALFQARIQEHSADEMLALLQRAEKIASGQDVYRTREPVMLVLSGDEIELFKRDNYRDNKALVDLAARLDAFNVIDVKVCRHWTGQRGIELTDLPPFIEGVSSADQESKRLESAGYAYF